jgi:hypothetical protein
MLRRPDLDTFESGAAYRHSHSGEAVEFLGVASMPELDGEDVGIFRLVEGYGYLIATTRGFEQAERFSPIGEDEEIDEATTAEWRAFLDRDES